MDPIDPTSGTPIYRQIMDRVESGIREGAYLPGCAIPSINELCSRFGVARDTVKKAYACLTEKGLLEARHGKGFYVTEHSNGRSLRVLILLDKLSAHQESILNGFTAGLEEAAECTLLMHNQDLNVFRYHLDSHLDRYDWYVVFPHFPLDEYARKTALAQLRRIPPRKLILLDRMVPDLKGSFGAAYQVVQKGLVDALYTVLDQLRTYRRIHHITQEDSTLYGKETEAEVAAFCRQNNLPFQAHNRIPESFRKGHLYIVTMNRPGQAFSLMIHRVLRSGLEPGRDLGIICYNDFLFNDLILGGLTSVSADLHKMGKTAAKMILDRKLQKLHFGVRLIRRKSF